MKLEKQPVDEGKAKKAVKAEKSSKIEAKAPVKPKTDSKLKKEAKASAKPKAPPKALGNKSKASPEKAIPQAPSPEVVILPQSQNKVFLVWRAQPSLDKDTDSWVVHTSFGEIARASASSRSVFLKAGGAFTVDIYRIRKDGSKELFISKTTMAESYSPSVVTLEQKDYSPRLNSSSNNFRRRISS